MGTLMVVTAKKNDTEASIEYDFGDSLEEAVEKFTEAVVFSGFKANGKILLQAAMRRRIEAEQPCDDLATSWKPGVQMERIVDPVAAAKLAYKNMDPDAKRAFLQSLQDIEE